MATERINLHLFRILSGAEPVQSLRLLLRLQGVGLTRLAHQLGIPYWRLERVLNGRAKPRDEELQKITGALGLPLLGDNESAARSGPVAKLNRRDSRDHGGEGPSRG